MSDKSGGAFAGISQELGDIGALAASTRGLAADTGQVPPSVADEAIREIGQQISQALLRFVPSGTGKFALDIHGAVRMYGNHLETHESIGAARINQDGGKSSNVNAVRGKHLEEFYKFDQKTMGQRSYTTDELNIMRDNQDPEYDSLVKKYPKIASLARKNHEQTDIVTITPQGLVTAQVKNLERASDYFRHFRKDADNDRFIVPMDKYESVRADLERRAKAGGMDGQQAKQFLKKLEPASASRWSTRHPNLAHAGKVAQDAATRAGHRIAVGVATDIALIAVGGVAWEIREYYRDPGTMTLWQRVDRLFRVIWDKIKAVFNERALREVGFEALSASVSMLAAPLKMAKAAVEKIFGVVSRLWMEFVAGKIKSLADVVSAILKAVYSVACIGVAIAVERSLANVLSVVPGGEMLSAVLAAAVAGVIIVIGNRGIETIVRTLAALSSRVELARRKREEIERFCAQVIPQMVADRERLEGLVDRHLAEREFALDSAFADMAAARDGEGIGRFLNGLQEMNAAYGKMLPWSSFMEFDTRMRSDEPLPMGDRRRDS